MPAFLLPAGPLLTIYILNPVRASKFEIRAFLPQLASCNFLKVCSMAPFWRKLAYGKYRSSTYMLINSTLKLAWRCGYIGGDDELGLNGGLENLVVKNIPSF